MMNHIYVSKTGDAHMNLSIDEYLLNACRNNVFDGVMLYFYVNDSAVIIGRNQNAWRECNIDAMKRDGVQLVRRHTGGGAVYHDTGNLNFSFIASERNYDTARQTAVILNAVRSFGVNAELTGRNDLTANGLKFSGNAYGLCGTARGQHGTLLINTDMSRLANYLNVSQKKLISKGIRSVRARVCNISELASDITIDSMLRRITQRFESEYGFCAPYSFSAEQNNAIEKLYEKQLSWEWQLGNSPEFDYCFDERLSFGEIQLLLKLRNGRIASCAVYTDALNTKIAEELKSALIGLQFDAAQLCLALSGLGAESRELGAYIRKRGL